MVGRERQLTGDEYAALGAALRQATAGCDGENLICLVAPARLGDTKSGPAVHPLSQAAYDLLNSRPRGLRAAADAVANRTLELMSEAKPDPEIIRLRA